MHILEKLAFYIGLDDPLRLDALQIPRPGPVCVRVSDGPSCFLCHGTLPGRKPEAMLEFSQRVFQDPWHAHPLSLI